MRNTFYNAPFKRAQKEARQAGNDPAKDGFYRSNMVHHQPSEMCDTPEGPFDLGGWERQMENEDIEETR